MHKLILIALLGASYACAQEAHYRYRGQIALNDLTYTPGAASSMTKSQLCDPAFRTKSVRNVSAEVKHRVCEEYGVDPKHCNGREYEIDHLIPLTGGGSNEIENLWPQPIAQAHEKDKAEDLVRHKLCSGEISLEEFQTQISNDWYVLYSEWGLDKTGSD